MDQEATQLEKQHVHAVYESTAPYFSDLQSKAWPRVRQFLQEQKPGSLVADIGCGTGKYLKVNSQVHALGCDYCGPLVEIARNRGCEVMRRIRAIKEMARVLVPGGRLMIYVWAMEQKNRHFEKQDVLVPWNRAFCAQPFPESSQPGRRRLCGHGESSRPYPAPCSECSCAVCYKEPCASRRSHSVDCEPVMARTCCANISKEGEEENGFYNSLGKSFRSWFSSRSLDESTLRKQIEKVRPLRNTDGRAEGTVSVQPCRRSSFDFNHREPFCTRQQSLDEEVFVETPSPKHLEWPGAGTGNCPQGLAPVWHGGIFTKRWNGAVRRNGGGDFLESAHPSENCVRAGELEEGTPSSAGRILRRIPALESADSNPDHAASVQAQQPDLSDAGAFMRYYHVFREGELSRLLAENVSELRILSAGNDHGNWCLIAEKRESCD